MFRFRGQRKDNGKWVVGSLTKCETQSRGKRGVTWIIENDTFNLEMDFRVFVHSHTLSISTGKPDSKKEEIFASFPIDGVMTEGGDLVEVPRWKHLGDMPVSYSPLWSRFLVGSFELSNALTNEITIIGKQGGGDDK